ncbi:hypothetical protein K439DRAFT_1620661 [Ramaria rubella]|nr:hypothetical protein K439DRAFT_1620661 [Ramaria rubella]
MTRVFLEHTNTSAAPNKKYTVMVNETFGEPHQGYLVSTHTSTMSKREIHLSLKNVCVTFNDVHSLSVHTDTVNHDTVAPYKKYVVTIHETCGTASTHSPRRSREPQQGCFVKPRKLQRHCHVSVKKHTVNHDTGISYTHTRFNDAVQDIQCHGSRNVWNTVHSLIVHVDLMNHNDNKDRSTTSTQVSTQNTVNHDTGISYTHCHGSRDVWNNVHSLIVHVDLVNQNKRTLQ